MAQNKLVYDVTYNLGDSITSWKVRLRLSLQSVPFWLAGAITNDAHLAANSLANVEIDSVGDMSIEINANNQPGLRQIGNRSWVMIDTPTHDLRTNVIIPLITDGVNTMRLVCRFDCDFGTGTMYRTFTGVVDMQQFEHDNIFLAPSASQEDYRMKFIAIDFAHSCLEQSAMTKAIDSSDGMIPLLLQSHTEDIYTTIYTTTVTAGVNSATQTLGSTKGMFVGEQLYFSAENAYRYIVTINSGVSVTLSAAITTTTGETVNCSFYTAMSGNVYRSDSWIINKYISNHSAADPIFPWETAFDSAPDGSGGKVIGQFPEYNFASLASIFKMFTLFIAACLEGDILFTTTEAAYSFNADHFQFNCVGSSGVAGYPTPPTPSSWYTIGQGAANNLLQRIYLNKHTHLENWSWNTALFPNRALPYREYNIDAAYTKGTGQYLNNGSNIGGNCPTLVDSLKKLLESFCLFSNFYITYDGANEVVNVRITSPASPTITPFVGASLAAMPLFPIYKEEYAAFPGFIAAGRSSASLIKPPPGDPAYLVDVPYGAPVNGAEPLQIGHMDNTQIDVWNPTYTDFLSRALGAINASLIAGTFWDDWLENQLLMLYDPVNHPNEIQCVDYAGSIVMPANAFPFVYAPAVSTAFGSIIPLGNYYYANPILACQTWGGGMLNLGTIQTVSAPLYQSAVALLNFSLYCGGRFGGSTLAGTEKIVYKTALTSSMTGISDAILKAVKQYGFDATAYNYLITGIAFNEWKVTGNDIRLVKITAIRSIGY